MIRASVAIAAAVMAALFSAGAGATEVAILRLNPDQYPPYVVSGGRIAQDLRIALPEGWTGDVEQVAWLIMGQTPGVVCGTAGARRACLLVGVPAEVDPFTVIAGTSRPAWMVASPRMRDFLETMLVGVALVGECVVESTGLMLQRMRADAYAVLTFSERSELDQQLAADIAAARALSPAFTRMESATLRVLEAAVVEGRWAPRRRRNAGPAPDPDGWLMHFKQRPPTEEGAALGIETPVGPLPSVLSGEVIVDPDAKAVWDLERTGRIRFIDDIETLWGAPRDWRRAEKRPHFVADRGLLSLAQRLASERVWSAAEITAAQDEYSGLVALTPDARVETLLRGGPPRPVVTARVQEVLADARAVFNR